MKKIFKLVLALGLCLSLVACASSEKPKDDSTASDAKESAITAVGVVIDTGGLGDHGYTDAVHKGAVTATTNLKLDLKVIESKEVADYSNNIRSICNEGVQVVVVAGSGFVDSLVEVSQEFPDVKFLIIDASVEDQPNVSSVLFKEQEASFLLGAFAGLMTKANNVGYIAGIESPLQERARVGFEAGYYSVKKSNDVKSVYTGTYKDVGKGKEIALSLFNGGADMVASFAGACNLGLFEAVNEQKEGTWALGAALGPFDKNPTRILASQVKTVDVLVANMLEKVYNGQFEAGAVSNGIAEGGVDFMFNPDTALVDGAVSAEVKAQIEELRGKVVSGEIKIPTTKEELAEFTK